MSCKARQHSDQKICHACGLVWDMNDPDPPACKQDQKTTNSGVNNMYFDIKDLNLNPSKKHIVFVGVGEHMMTVLDRVSATGMKGATLSDTSMIEDAVASFERGLCEVIILPRTTVFGWRCKFTLSECDVHFVGKFLEEEIAQGLNRITRDSLAETGDGTASYRVTQEVLPADEAEADATCELHCPIYGNLALTYNEMVKVAETNKDLSQALLERLAEAGAREGILMDTVRLNHEDRLRLNNEDYCLYGEGDDLFNMNTMALDLPEDDTAIKIVLTNKNPIEQVRHFNRIAGNTDDVFNVRQAAMYFGLQLEEMAEKMYHLGFNSLGNEVDTLGTILKRGCFDHRFADVDRKAILDDDIDQLVVTIGSMLSQGADISGAFNEVQRANMDKVWPDGTMHRDANGKIVKPDGWREPDLSPFVYEEADLSTVAHLAFTDVDSCQCKAEDGTPLNQCEDCPR